MAGERDRAAGPPDRGIRSRLVGGGLALSPLVPHRFGAGEAPGSGTWGRSRVQAVAAGAAASCGRWSRAARELPDLYGSTPPAQAQG